MAQTLIQHWEVPGAEESWDRVVIGGRTWPGIAKVTISGSTKLDVKTAPGANGATITFQGNEPKKISIEVSVWTAEQWTEIQECIAQIEPSASKGGGDSFDIGHPVAYLRGVKAIMIDSVDGPSFDTVGVAKFSIKAVEYFPPPKKKATKTPDKPKDQANAHDNWVETNGTGPSEDLPPPGIAAPEGGTDPESDANWFLVP